MDVFENIKTKLDNWANGDINNYPYIAEDLVKLNKIKEAIYVMGLYEQVSANNRLCYITCGNFYNICLKIMRLQLIITKNISN